MICLASGVPALGALLRVVVESFRRLSAAVAVEARTFRLSLRGFLLMNLFLRRDVQFAVEAATVIVLFDA